VNVLWLGRNQPYQPVHARMRKCLEERIDGIIGDSLLLVEHQPTYTVGRRRESADNILDPGEVPIIPVERGGDVTFHGPGQLTGYPIVKLPDHRKDLHAYLRFLEDFWIGQLGDWGIDADRDERNTGVWAQGKKMVAIGIACRRWVAWHGFACNLSTDLEYFRRINPCGMDSSLVTRLDHHREIPEIEAVADEVGSRFALRWKQWCSVE
jgi:lipoate-protein ligase B